MKEKETFYLFLLSVLGIMWWIGISGIIYDVIEDVHREYKVNKYTLHVGIIVFILLIIYMHPQFLKSL